MRKTVLFALFVTLAPMSASACVEGTKCLTVPKSQITTQGFDVGDTLPRGKYQILMNAQYYGLPRTKDGTWYYKVERRVMRVRPDTLEVLEDVTNKTNRAF